LHLFYFVWRLGSPRTRGPTHENLLGSGKSGWNGCAIRLTRLLKTLQFEHDRKKLRLLLHNWLAAASDDSVWIDRFDYFYIFLKKLGCAKKKTRPDVCWAWVYFPSVRTNSVLYSLWPTTPINCAIASWRRERERERCRFLQNAIIITLLIHSD